MIDATANAAYVQTPRPPSPGVAVHAADRGGAISSDPQQNESNRKAGGTGPRVRSLPRWWVRNEVSCPRCGVAAGKNCWSVYRRARRIANHIERVRKAEAVARENGFFGRTE
jgi:hypothetical protein